MSRKFTITILLLLFATALVAACSSSEEPTPEPVEVNAVQQPRVVSAEAFVVPVQEASLAFEANGLLVELNVEEGDEVNEGDLLARLDDSTEQAQLAEAQANQSQVESRLAEAAAGQAEAEANLAKVKAPPTQEEVDQLEANLARAQAALADAITGPTPEDIAIAEAAVRTAQAQLAEVLADARSEDLQAAGSRLLQTQADVREAQSVYDQVRYGDPDDVLSAGVVLEKATLAYEAAQADYDKLVNGATKEQVATVQARVAEAEAALAKTKAGSTPEQIAQAQAEVARAEAELARLLAGATDEDIAIAEARVETTQAAVESARASVEAAAAQVASAQVQVDKKQLRAPFSGTVGTVDINEGEFVQAGAPLVSMGDFSTWQIETDDLTEIDVVDVQPGAKVSISVDALPGEEFEGEVERITPKSETKAGDVTYTVLINITSGNTSRLKWGMTTFVDIEADPGIPR
ncbi:MAG: biotin/lipoyl-binding protein [Anaerolineae bacterium]